MPVSCGLERDDFSSNHHDEAVALDRRLRSLASISDQEPARQRAEYSPKQRYVGVAEGSGNVFADSVFLLIERLLFSRCDMAAVLRRFEPFLLADKPIFR